VCGLGYNMGKGVLGLPVCTYDDIGYIVYTGMRYMGIWGFLRN
jgi:hypothetical protein